MKSTVALLQLPMAVDRFIALAPGQTVVDVPLIVKRPSLLRPNDVFIETIWRTAQHTGEWTGEPGARMQVWRLTE